jgi:hypothetical protein
MGTVGLHKSPTGGILQADGKGFWNEEGNHIL